MAEPFVITAVYKNQERNFDAVLLTFGYSYTIEIMVNETKIVFEPDEERNFRARLPGEAGPNILPDPLLLQAIAEALENAFR